MANNPKRVSNPTQQSRTGGTAKQAKSSIVEGPTASSGNLQPFNRGEKGKK
jgi:hypothetical protein